MYEVIFVGRAVNTLNFTLPFYLAVSPIASTLVIGSSRELRSTHSNVGATQRCYTCPWLHAVTEVDRFVVGKNLLCENKGPVRHHGYQFSFPKFP